MALSLSNFINVTLTPTGQGLTNFNVNTLALFTDDSPNFVEDYRIYTNASDVETDFGTGNLTTDMANAIFSQSPNLLSGDGYLIVAPLNGAVSATQGDFVTSDISANISNFASVTDGEFAITLNGSSIDVTGLNFTNIDTSTDEQALSDIATIIKKKLLDVFISSDSTALTFTSKKFGSTSAISFATVSGGTGTDLTGSNYLDTAAGTGSSGSDSSGETVDEAITRLENQEFFVGCLSTLNLEDSAIETIADSIQSKDKIYFSPTATTEDLAGLGTTIADASNTHTRILLYTDGIKDSKLYAAGYAGRGLSVNFTGSNTSQTLNLKSLATITADSGFATSGAQTIAANAEDAGVDFYASYAGLSVITSTGGNEYFDNVYSDIWLKLALQVAGFNYLQQTNTKIPQTEEGMEGLKGAYAEVLEQAVANGVLATGLRWNTAIPFGNPEDLQRNIQDAGYYIFSQPIALQSQSQRENRTAPLVQIAAKRAGAIHESDVNITIEA